MVHTILNTLQKLPDGRMEVWDSKEHSGFINSCMKRWLVCNVEHSGGGGESAMGFQGIGNATTREGFSDRKIVDS